MHGRYIDQLPPTCPQLGTWPATKACALTGNQTSKRLVHRLALRPLSHTSQGHGVLLWVLWSSERDR